jgi:ubiquinone/menaquinone biosynthesis C-methylase UbiE
MSSTHSEKAALRGEPSYVWRAGQDRRLQMIRQAAAEQRHGKVFEIGVGLGAYLSRLAEDAQQAIGLDVELERAQEAHQLVNQIICGVGENLPFPANSFDMLLSNEVLEHVQDDRKSIEEMVRTLKPGGRMIIFCPNRGYPFETHGVYWRGNYRFGNIPMVNYLPNYYRNKLAPHVRAYTRNQLEKLFKGLPVKFVSRAIIFGAYDNIIARHPGFGNFLRKLLQFLEKTPFKVFGLSHFWVVEKLN